MNTSSHENVADGLAVQADTAVRERRLGLVLGGGGSKGAAHLGVLSVLESLALPIDLIVGTSTGGAIGALYSAGHSIPQIAQLLRSITMWRLVDRDPAALSFLGSRRLRMTLEEALGAKTFADLRIPCAVVATDLATGTTHVLNQGPLVDALLATTAFPGIFPPVQHGERHDGPTIEGWPSGSTQVALPSARSSFFQMGSRFLTCSITKRQTANASARCGAAAAMAMLASSAGTRPRRCRTATRASGHCSNASAVIRSNSASAMAS